MKSILSAVIGATLALSAIEANAQATPGERQVALTIETDTLANALDKWAQQSGFQIFVQDWEAAKKLPARSLKGTFAAQDALEQLLLGTPLTYVWISDKAVSIRKRMPQTVPTALQRTSLEGQQAIPVARFSGDDAAGQSSGPVVAAERADSSSRPSGLSIETLEQITVTGSHIRGVENQTAPTTVLDRQYIESTGITTVTRLMESLPQNFALANQSGGAVPGVTGEGGAQGSSINLRAIGEGNTLVLLNGRRMALGFAGSAVDTSVLPVSAIERVEILTDGASALYGSDAVGGVVNFVLRSNLDGAETRLQSGWAAGGVNEYTLSQALGNAWDSGNALLSLAYYKRDLLPASERDFVPSTSGVGSIYPEDETYSAVFNGRQSLTDAASVFAEALYTRRDSFNQAGFLATHDQNTTENPQVTATLGVDWGVGDDWQVEVSGSYARNKLDARFDSDLLVQFGFGSFLYDSSFVIEAAEAKADGPLFHMPGGNAHLAVGVDWRSESFEYQRTTTSGLLTTTSSQDQIVRSAFAEVYLPLVGPDNAFGGVHRLELSLAGRLDDYSSFGSSVDPRYGLMWEPVAGLRVRGSYGTSYRAPKLDDYSFARNSATLGLGLDAGVPGGISQQLFVGGTDVAGLSAEESINSSIGLEITPPSAPQLQLALNYYDIRYSGKIATPPFASVILANPAAFGSLTIRNPTPAQVDQYIAFGRQGQGFLVCDPGCVFDGPFDPASVQVIVDGRRRNLSGLNTSGVDLSVQYGFSALGSDFQLGLNGTHIFELEQRTTSTSAALDTVDTFYNPPDWRARAFVNWTRNAWLTNLFVNHTDSYEDNRLVPSKPIGSYTTLDARLSYDFGVHFKDGPLSGVVVSASVQNLFDRDPPHTAIVSTTLLDMGFDPTNANPMGRLIGVEVAKVW